ncbi:hypothetical protein JXA32_08435, partial [Candidatus Sumerlaeota bacterium]|nr:hypothetical protein [Candidatus Sumerlaeota bacterium]
LAGMNKINALHFTKCQRDAGATLFQRAARLIRIFIAVFNLYRDRQGAARNALPQRRQGRSFTVAVRIVMPFK